MLNLHEGSQEHIHSFKSSWENIKHGLLRMEYTCDLSDFVLILINHIKICLIQQI